MRFDLVAACTDATSANSVLAPPRPSRPLCACNSICMHVTMGPSSFARPDPQALRCAAQVEAMQASEHLYDDLARSLAPGVFGHVDIKKAILLMLLGGVHKQTSEV